MIIFQLINELSLKINERRKRNVLGIVEHSDDEKKDDLCFYDPFFSNQGIKKTTKCKIGTNEQKRD